MNLGDLKRIEAAQVWKAGVPAAQLRRATNEVVFEYDPGYTGPAVALSLPRGCAPVRCPGGALPPFFSGLLPEGRRLTAIHRAAKTSADDELTLLLALGADTVGDVQVLPRHHPPADTEPAGVDLADADFGELLERAVGNDPRDLAAIAGAQDKVSGRMISLPLQYEGAAYLLKLDPPEFPHLVANEAFFAAAARASGLPTAETTVVHDRHGRPGLLVRRFDRVRTANGLRRLAQEDGCQVLGRYPADKFRLTTEQVVQALAAPCGAPVVAARDLIQQVAFAYLTGNGDLHAKNLSILLADEWRVTPAYDLPSSYPYGDTTMAMTIGGKDREDLGRADFLALGEACGVPPRAIARGLDRLLLAMPNWLDRLDELPFDRRRVHKLRQASRYRAQRLRG